MHVFKGREYNRDLTILYDCSPGSLLAGNYFFPSEPADAAARSYRSVYDILISVYGAPALDTTPWQVGGSIPDKRIVASDPRKYMTVWWKGHLSLHLGFSPNLPSESPGLRVWGVFGPRTTHQQTH